MPSKSYPARQARQIRVTFRWMIRRDLCAVVAIEEAAFPQPLTRENVLTLLRQRNCIGMVAEERGERIAGYYIYELHERHVLLNTLAVRADLHGCGIGRQMVEKLLMKCSYTRPALYYRARESNLDAHLFLQACGFRALAVEPEHFADTMEDAYLFRRPATPAPRQGAIVP